MATDLINFDIRVVESVLDGNLTIEVAKKFMKYFYTTKTPTFKEKTAFGSVKVFML